MSYNKVIIMGRLTADPELRRTGSGVAVTSFTVAVDRQSSKEDATDFIDCVAWRKTAELVEQYFHKGKEILVDGELQTRTYTAKDGSKRKVAEVNASNVRFVGKRDSDGYQQQETQEAQQSGDFFQIPDTDTDDNDLPF